MAVKERVKELREALDLTQEELGKRSELGRIEINRLESGANKGGMAQLQKRLAVAAGVSLDDMNAYLEGGMTLDAIMSRRRRGSGTHRAEADPIPERAAAVQWAQLAGYPGPVIERARKSQPTMKLSYEQWIDQVRGWKVGVEAGTVEESGERLTSLGQEAGSPPTDRSARGPSTRRRPRHG